MENIKFKKKNSTENYEFIGVTFMIKSFIRSENETGVL